MFFDRYLHTILHSNRYYLWYVFSRKLTKAWLQQLLCHYTNSPKVQDKKDADKGNEQTNATKQVIFICNGTILSGGLADRLKGILSTYMLCKEEGWQFKLLFNNPFPLQLFLQPNTYDWLIPESEVSFDLAEATPIPLEISAESTYQAHKQKEWLRHRISAAKTPQVHVYTNAMFSYLADFSATFHQLFRPTDMMLQALEREKAHLQPGYVSISARFVNVLGDFTDTVDCAPLSEAEKKKLLNACMQCIERCHDLNPNKHILVNSDSSTFLAEAARLPYTYIVPGTITHIDTECTECDSIYKRYEKTILDYLLISEAETIYRIDGKHLHTSGYPLSAAKINNRKFVILEIKSEE